MQLAFYLCLAPDIAALVGLRIIPPSRQQADALHVTLQSRLKKIISEWYKVILLTRLYTTIRYCIETKMKKIRYIITPDFHTLKKSDTRSRLKYIILPIHLPF